MFDSGLSVDEAVKQSDQDDSWWPEYEKPPRELESQG